MATLGHAAVGMLAARAYRRRGTTRLPLGVSMALWSALSFLPDLDILGFPLGIRYGDPWGHRGATHSLAFAILVGLACGLAGRLFHAPALRASLLAMAVVASHGVLDSLTNGGLGIAFLWPLDLTRYFAPWNPIPVAPIGAGLLSARGFAVAATELLMFLPLFAWALWPRSGRSADS